MIGSSNAVGAPMTTGSRGSKRSRGWADADPANGLHIPTLAWREETSWNRGARNPKSLAELARKAPIIVENLTEEEHEAAFERWLSTRAREAAKMQNAYANFLKAQRTEVSDEQDSEQFRRVLWLNPELHSALEELGIEDPGPDEDEARRAKHAEWVKMLAERLSPRLGMGQP